MTARPWVASLGRASRIIARTAPTARRLSLRSSIRGVVLTGIAALLLVVLGARPAAATEFDTMTLNSSANPSVSGQGVTFTATVTPLGPSTPTGTVTFFDGAAVIGSVALSGGVATFTTSALTVGAHTITAFYGGDSNFFFSSANLSQVVNTDTTSTVLNSSANPSAVGQAVTFTATITVNAPGSGTPTGTVSFLDGATPIGTATVSGGAATFTTSVLTVGSHTITASYSGGANFTGSTGTAAQVVNTDTTSTVLNSSANPSAIGQAVTFTATITVNAPGSGTPTGTVSFLDGATPIGTATVSGGAATFTTSVLTVGSHTITASYSGDANFTGSTGTVAQVVNTDTTSTVLSSSPNPSILRQAVTFTATVSPNAPGSGTPTGTVSFLDGATPIGTATVSGGAATFTTSVLTVGSHTISAVYSGDTKFSGSTGMVSQAVKAGTSSTVLTASPNPGNRGQTVTFTATVSSGGPPGTPAGTVTFKDGATTLGTATLAAGVASFSTASLTQGAHSITATYNGDTTFTGSTASLTETVEGPLSTTTTLTSSVNPSNLGQAVTFTATVASGGPPGTPTGIVTFKDGATTLSTVSLVGGAASFATSSLTAGPHTITASYGGDATFQVSTASIAETVNQGTTTTTLASSQNPSNHDQPVTFTATVASGGGTPTGTVTFFDAGQPIGAGTLAAGVATFTTASLTIGTHSITASYAGVPGFVASTSAALSQAVNTPADSIKLRTMQVEATQLVAQASGEAIAGAISAAISDGFSDDGALVTPSANGAHINFAGQLASANQAPPDDASAPDPALGRATVLSDNGLKPAMSSFTTAPSNLTQPKPGSTISVQTAQTPALVTPPHGAQAWQVWADVRSSGWDTNASSGNLTGTQTNALLGVTRRLTPDLLIGAVGGYEHFNYSSQLLNGRLQGDGWTAGGYFGWRIDQQLRFDAAVAHSSVSYNGTAGMATGSFPGSRWLASAGLTGTYKFAPFEIEPSARVFALWEHEDPYTDSLGTPQASFSFNTGRASGGLKVSYPMPWSPTTALTPYVGLYGDYYFSSTNGGTVLLPSNFIRGGAGRVIGGVGAHLDNGVKLAVGAEYGGIGNNFQNWTVMGRISVPLSTLFGEPTPMAARAAKAGSVAAASPADAPQARQLASLDPAAAMAPARAQNNPNADQTALEAKKAALFQQMLADPANLDVTFAYAETAAQLGDNEAAVSALERMLLFNPDLARVDLELGALYFRMGSFEMARSYFDKALAANPAPEVKARVDQYVAQITREEAPSRLTGYVLLGGQYQSDANVAPGSATINSPIGPLLLSNQFVKMPDENLFLTGSALYSYDLGTQSRDTLEVTGTGFVQHYFRVQRLALDLGELTVGPRFRFQDPGLTGIQAASLKPYTIVNEVGLGQQQYFDTFGAGLEGAAALWHDVVAKVVFEIRHKNFTNQPDRPNSTGLNGSDKLVSLVLSKPVTANSLLSFEFDFLNQDTRFKYYANRSYSGLVSYSIHYDDPTGIIGLPWLTTFVVSRAYSLYRAPDPCCSTSGNPAIFSTSVRDDRHWRFGITQTFQIASNIDVVVQAQRDVVSSNLSVYGYTSNSVLVGPEIRF